MIEKNRALLSLFSPDLIVSQNFYSQRVWVVVPDFIKATIQFPLPSYHPTMSLQHIGH